MEAILEKTSKSDQKIAKALKPVMIEASDTVGRTSGRTVALKIDGYKKALEVPKSAVNMFFKILESMAEGNTFAVFIADDNDVSTQQAADILGVSRPHLVKLLESGEIPFFKTGTHRRIDIQDVIAYGKKLRKNRTDKLNFLASQAQEHNLGY